MFKTVVVCLGFIITLGVNATHFIGDGHHFVEKSVVDSASMQAEDISDHLRHESLLRQRREVTAKSSQPSASCAFCKKDAMESNSSFCKKVIKHEKFQIYSDDELYKASCLSGGPTDPEWPVFPSLKNFDTVELICCAPPSKGSYTAALLARNITANKLKLVNVPADTDVTAAALADAPPALELSSDSKLVLAPGAVASLVHLSSLSLHNVDLPAVSDGLPSQLEELELHHTGISTFPVEAQSVMKLTINEERLTNLSQPAPQLIYLSLHTPVVALPQAPLQVISFHGSAVNNLPALDLTKYSLLIMQIDGQIEVLPAKLLKNQLSMVMFTAVNCSLTSLAPDLFEDTVDISSIDLSYNKLETLPSNLFSRLPALRSLFLSYNRLSVTGMYSGVAPLRSLMDLNLRGNPIGDFCSKGANSSFHLPELQFLDVSETGLTRICPDWWLLPVLNSLHLDKNQLQDVSCTEWHVPNRDFPLTVSLMDNPMECLACTSEQVQKGYEFEVSLILSQPLCSEHLMPKPVLNSEITDVTGQEAPAQSNPPLQQQFTLRSRSTA